MSVSKAVIVSTILAALTATLAQTVDNSKTLKIPRIKPNCGCGCGPNSYATNCYNDCGATCKERITGSDKVCLAVCGRHGCFCNPGYLKHDNGTCVTEDECSPPDCPKGKVYTECGSACPTTCENKDDTCKACTQQCVKGCFCAEGTVLAPNGSCVPPKQCPQRTCTGPNEVFDPCPPTCPRTENCSNLWSKIPCTPVDCCTPQCRCKSGFFRNDDNKCVSAQECMGITGSSVTDSSGGV